MLVVNHLTNDLYLRLLMRICAGGETYDHDSSFTVLSIYLVDAQDPLNLDTEMSMDQPFLASEEEYRARKEGSWMDKLMAMGPCQWCLRVRTGKTIIMMPSMLHPVGSGR